MNLQKVTNLKIVFNAKVIFWPFSDSDQMTYQRHHPQLLQTDPKNHSVEKTEIYSQLLFFS